MGEKLSLFRLSLTPHPACFGAEQAPHLPLRGDCCLPQGLGSRGCSWHLSQLGATTLSHPTPVIQSVIHRPFLPPHHLSPALPSDRLHLRLSSLGHGTQEHRTPRCSHSPMRWQGDAQGCMVRGALEVLWGCGVRGAAEGPGGAGRAIRCTAHRGALRAGACRGLQEGLPAAPSTAQLGQGQHCLGTRGHRLAPAVRDRNEAPCPSSWGAPGSSSLGGLSLRGLSSAPLRFGGQGCARAGELVGTPGREHQLCCRVCSVDQPQLGRWC